MSFALSGPVPQFAVCFQPAPAPAQALPAHASSQVNAECFPPSTVTRPPKQWQEPARAGATVALHPSLPDSPTHPWHCSLDGGGGGGGCGIQSWSRGIGPAVHSTSTVGSSGGGAGGWRSPPPRAVCQPWGLVVSARRAGTKANEGKAESKLRPCTIYVKNNNDDDNKQVDDDDSGTGGEKKNNKIKSFDQSEYRSVMTKIL